MFLPFTGVISTVYNGYIKTHTYSNATLVWPVSSPHAQVKYSIDDGSEVVGVQHARRASYEDKRGGKRMV